MLMPFIESVPSTEYMIAVGFVKLTRFTPKSRYIVDGSSTQIQ